MVALLAAFKLPCGISINPWRRSHRPRTGLCSSRAISDERCAIFPDRVVISHRPRASSNRSAMILHPSLVVKQNRAGISLDDDGISSHNHGTSADGETARRIRRGKRIGRFTASTGDTFISTKSGLVDSKATAKLRPTPPPPPCVSPPQRMDGDDERWPIKRRRGATRGVDATMQGPTPTRPARGRRVRGRK